MGAQRLWDLLQKEPYVAALGALTGNRPSSGVPTLVVARTDANSATLITSDVDERDHPFLTGRRTAEGFYTIKNGLEMAIAVQLGEKAGRPKHRQVPGRVRRDGLQVPVRHPRRLPREEPRREYDAAPEDEVPFEIPRD